MKGTVMACDDKVVIGQTHGTDDAESVLIAYLMGVEAVRKGKEALMWLTKDAVLLATPNYIDKIDVSGAPNVAELHREFVEAGGRLFACPVCLKTHGLEGAELIDGAEAKGAPALYEFAQGGALTFNY
jgi:predicted peroxiredoxin